MTRSPFAPISYSSLLTLPACFFFSYWYYYTFFSLILQKKTLISQKEWYTLAFEIF